MSPVSILGLLLAVGTVIKDSMDNDNSCDCWNISFSQKAFNNKKRVYQNSKAKK